jgi:hypothetical protein
MAFKGWPKVRLTAADGQEVSAIAPLIVSASRFSDIPAFHGEWFVKQLQQGFCHWTNPYSRSTSLVSLEQCRFFVFWTKNPAPFVCALDRVIERGAQFYLHFTCNDYDTQRYEPFVPPLEQRIHTFHALAARFGMQRLVWRFDPVLLSDSLSLETIIERAQRLARALQGATDTMVFSFVGIHNYRRVQAHLRRCAPDMRELTRDEKISFVKEVAPVVYQAGMRMVSCAEPLDLSPWGVGRSRCIDPQRIGALAADDRVLQRFLDPQPQQMSLGLGLDEGTQRLAHPLRDSGQRELCGCIVSKEIGRYGSCGHGCVYCYANPTA